VRAIAQKLNERGVPPPATLRRVGRAAWSKGSVWSILRNPIYAGTLVYGKARYRDIGRRRGKLRVPDEEVRRRPAMAPSLPAVRAHRVRSLRQAPSGQATDARSRAGVLPLRRVRRERGRAHRPFIKKVAKSRASGRRRNLDDLEQAGTEGFFEALENFDPKHGVRVWTYAKHEIEGAIRDAAVDMGHAWSIPEHVRTKLVEKRRTLKRLAHAGNLDPERAEVADAMGVSDETMDYLDGVSSNVAYLESAPGFDSASADYDPDADMPHSLHDMVTDDQRIDGWSAPWPSAEEHAELGERRAQIERLLAALDPRQRDVVILYYGLNGSAMSATQIGQRLGGRRVTKQAGAKIVKAALARMRVEAEARGWAPEERKPRLTPTEDAVRAFMRRRVETVRRHRRYDEFDAENDIHLKERGDT
jgi:RNA polymerase sigma factor for flagellar operon FliA